MEVYKKIRFWDILITSIISLFLTVKCYDFLYDKIGYGSLSDFYTGVSIYNNHNKYLDIYIYIIYLLLFFIVLPFISVLRDKIFKEKEENEPEFKLLNKIIPILQKFKNIQYLFPFCYIFLHPMDGNLYPKLTIVITVLIIISLIDVYIRNKNNRGFSPLALTSLFFLFCFSSYTTGFVHFDDHHFGEKFATFFMHNNFNLEYYKDIMLVHGYSDICSSWLGNFFFDQNNIHGYCYGEALSRNIIFIITVLFALFVFNNNILYIAPHLLLVVPSASVLAVGVYLSLIKENILNKPVLWFWLYIIFSVLFASYWTTIGSFWVIASLPAFIYICSKIRNKKLHFWLAGLFLFALSIIFRNSFFEYLHQAGYYIKGTLYAFGNEFIDNKNKPFLQIAYEWFYKIFALFFIPVIILETIKQFKNKNRNISTILFLSFSLLIVFVSLKYTLGRVDNGKFERMEYISYPFLCFIMPYWCYKFANKLQKVNIERLLAFLFVFAILLEAVYGLPWKIKQIRKPLYKGDTQLFNVGDIKFLPLEEERLTAIKEYLYSKSENETFMDLTNRGMHYLYFNKVTPVIHMSFFNSIASKQAIETVERIRKNPPDNILVYSKNNVHDAVFPSLRVNALYRWIFLNQKYAYQEAGYNVLLVKTNEIPKYTPEQLYNLDYYFGMENLKFLPEVWANSINTLPLINVITDYTVQAFGDEIKIKFHNPEKVKNLDLLYFNTNEQNKPAVFTISINGAKSKIKCISKSGKILVPMDNFPSWLLNDELKEITINSNIIIKFPEVKFYNRIFNHTL